MDNLDREIINRMQYGVPVCDRPFQEMAARLGMSEQQLVDRLQRLKDAGYLSRFGPLYNVEKMGGAFVLCAMHVPVGEFDDVALAVNTFPQVAHNYQRQHHFNMWFVLATETPEEADAVVRRIASQTGLEVYRFPKLDEYYVGFRLSL